MSNFFSNTIAWIDLLMMLAVPRDDMLSSYRAALAGGWSPDNTRPAAAQEELEKSAADPHAFVKSMIDKEARGGPVILPDGTSVVRLPGFRLWMWDGEFCGSIGLRWQVGTEQLPPHCLGHIGYSVVPRKRRLGYASAALRQLLPYAKAEGLAYVELTTDTDNEPSQKVIIASGGVMVERFTKSAHHASAPALRWRIDLEELPIGVLETA